MQEKQYFRIDLEQLPKDTEIFAFNLYLFNSVSNKYTVFLHANSPLDDLKQEELKQFLEKGASLAIKKNQKRTFLSDAKLNEKDIPDLMNEGPDELQVLREKRQKELEGEKLDEFMVNTETVKAFKNDDFMPLIDQVRKELSIFPVTISHTVSLAIDLSQKLLKEDNLTNRIVALSYLCAKASKIDDIEALGDLIVAAFLFDTGLTQMDAYLSHKNKLEYNDRERKAFKKKGGLSHHLIRKSGLEISPRCLKIILEHTERADGSGYPNMKRIEKIEPLAMVLACINHLIKFSEGIISGKKTPMSMVINSFENQTPLQGLEFQFGEQVRENVVYLLKEKEFTKAA